MSPTPKQLLARASAAPNMALSKYWGKRPGLAANLPVADSLSLTLGGLRTTVELREAPGDSILWAPVGSTHAAPLPGSLLGPYLRVLETARRDLALPPGLEARFLPSIEPAQGLAGSAAAMAAFAGALLLAAGRGLEAPQDLRLASILARVGSGSACRSIHGGFVRWQMGQRDDGQDSHAFPVAPPQAFPGLGLTVLRLASGPKAVGSTEGMKASAATSPLFPWWTQRCQQDCDAIQRALLAGDFPSLGRLAQDNALAMHAVCLTTHPPILYATAQTIQAFHLADQLQAQGLPVFATLDAGPSPVFVHLPDAEGPLLAALARQFPGIPTLHLEPGQGVQQ